MSTRGRLRVLLGAAPGVGKTYTMLEEGDAFSAKAKTSSRSWKPTAAPPRPR
jgi:K+-sensing histidine kinase KdpD